MPSFFGLALLGVYRLLFPWGFINATIAGGSHIRELLALASLFVVQQAVMFGRYWFRGHLGQRVVLLLQHKKAAPVEEMGLGTRAILNGEF